MSTTEFTAIMRRLDRIESRLVPAQTTWISEAEAMQLTGLKKTALYEKRKSGQLNWSSVTGRKVKYLKQDILDYLNKNSTIS